MNTNSAVRGLNSLMPLTSVTRANTPRVVNASVMGSPSMVSPLMIFVALLVVFLALLAYYYDQFMDALQNWSDSISMWLTGKGDPVETHETNEVLQTSTPEQDRDEHITGVESIVEKALPPAKEVFTVSKNEYSYYDAAPLCKALGAELATYDEVKRAWQNGADWCNYGWVKGQMAVYPTQNSSYEELQQGPADQRGVCGKPGLNGGYFDNPELKFGVTCSGKKPAQSQHDATAVTSGATRPLTASGLKFEQKVQQFKEESDTLGILPFNKQRW